MKYSDLLIDLTPHMQRLEQSLVEYLLTTNEPTNQVIRHIFSAGGKRLRPLFFLLFSRLFNYEKEHLYPIASVCEYIHTASLLHDDVIDNSTVRRNKPTANSIWGDQTAVLVGDLIYSAACRLMVKTAHLELIDTFAECIRLMSECELFQLDVLWKPEVSEQDYFKIVGGKTAILFEASCKTPGFLAGASREVVDAAGDFGRNLGIAFQISDDCLDLEGNEKELGKSVMADLLEGKVTLPFILGMKSETPAADQLKTNLQQLFSATSDHQQISERLMQELQASGGLELAKQMAEAYLKKAEDALTLIEKKVPGAQVLETMQCIRQIIPFILQRRA